MSNRAMLFSPRLALLFFVGCGAGCGSNEIGDSRDVDPETIFLDYRLSGEENHDDLTLMLQFRYGGPNGTTLLLGPPSKVELDGREIPGDSSNMTGAFYEVIRPLAEFTGEHTIVFTDARGRKYTERFAFRPLTMRSTLPPTFQRGDLIIELDGLESVDYVRVILNDTSFHSDGINRVATVKFGRVLVSAEDLQALVNGPVHLELYRERDRRLRETPREGGRFSMSYGLRRDFMLTN